MNNIIETELPITISAVFLKAHEMRIATTADGEKILDEYLEAQQAAILRFCEAVEKEAKTSAGNGYKNQDINWFIGHAMKKLRDQIANVLFI